MTTTPDPTPANAERLLKLREAVTAAWRRGFETAVVNPSFSLRNRLLESDVASIMERLEEDLGVAAPEGAGT